MQQTQSPKAGERTQHTTGPWKTRSAGPSMTVGAKGQVICKLFGQYYPDLTVQDANARLIAAAPALLRAVKNALGCFGNDETWWTEQAGGPVSEDQIRAGVIWELQDVIAVARKQ